MGPRVPQHGLGRADLKGLDNPNHPLWSFLRLTVLMITLAFVLWMNASHFDQTEIRTLIYTFLAAATYEGVTQAFTRKRGQ